MYVLRRWRPSSRGPERLDPYTRSPAGLARLRGNDRRLAEALRQLSQGIPLNWAQVEDDPELATLAVLMEPAKEVRRAVSGGVPSETRAQILAALEKHLPEPKVRAQKEEPKALAGFSESVPVLTQADEDVPPLISNVPQWIGATFAAGLVVIGIMWAISNVFFPVYRPQYAWIDLVQAGRSITVQDQQASGKVLPACVGFNLSDPSSTRKFIRLPDDREQARASVNFPIQFMPRTLTMTVEITATQTAQPSPGAETPGATPTSRRGPTAVPLPTGTRVVTYGFQLTDTSVAPCVGDTPDPNDPGASVKLNYVLNINISRRSGQSTSFVVFQAREQPVFIDVSKGSWKEIKGEGWHGAYWKGAPYRDPEGKEWIGDVSVLVFENGGTITTMVGDARQGVTERMLTHLADYLHSTGSGGNP
ncbi:MAG TPA: hypothetical protein VM409_05635 [Chloroflexia bacterium]|nr:hypothetical protein [Chloroflexia bacterium]